MNTSRYAGQEIAPPSKYNARPEISPRILKEALPLDRARLLYEYVVVQGDRIDQLAFRGLGDSRLWWVLADLNPQVDPLFLRGGDVLLVPPIEVLS